MLQRHLRAACAAAAATGALLVAGLSGSASAQPTASPAAPTAARTLRTSDAPPALLGGLRRDLGLDRRQAERRLANEAEAGATAGRLRAALGADFAGAWVRGAESATLTVATTDPADVPAIRARGAVAAVVGHSLTAGHCGRAGSTTTGSNRVAQGTFQASVFPGNDMAWVAAGTNWTATPNVNGSGVQVAGSAQATVGSSVCRSGSTTGWHCGTVQQLNTSVTYQEGTVSGVTRTSVCAEPGDSGGSFVSGSQAQGVTSGGSGDCTSGGTTFFQPINPILQSYGLTLKTTAPGPGDPGDPGGTWSAGTVYQAGDTVTYGGAGYRCLQGHQAQAGWEPPNAPALWQRQ